ncbi:MAG: hypothetical protein PVS2B3_06780 [Steroidobacteraceae bacterium]
MRERLTTLVCALGALLLFATLFVRGDAPDARRAGRPTTAERRGNGRMAAMTWLRGEGMRTGSLRERFDRLAARRDLPATGNLLIVTLPVATPFSLGELAALNNWVHAGNTLLVLATLADRPDWGRAGVVFLTDLQGLTGLDGRALRAAGDAHGAAGARPGVVFPLASPPRRTLVANRPHAYLRGVGAATAWSDYPPQTWTVNIPHDGFVLSLAHQRENGADVLWLRSVSAGTIIVSGFGSLFSNRALGLDDNARLLANIVGGAVSPAGAVLFDDEHQGLTAAYDPVKFYRDPRLYQTLIVLASLWVTAVLGGTRLRLPRRRRRAPREVELVRASGGFLARVLRPAAAARRMFEHFFARLRALRRRGSQDGDPPWEWLKEHPRLQRAEVLQLEEWYAEAYSDQRVPLRQLHNLIVRMERQLTA